MVQSSIFSKKTISTNSLFTQILIHIKKSYQSTANEDLIKTRWENVGFVFELEQGV